MLRPSKGSPASQPMVPMVLASAMMPLPPKVPVPSFRLARMPNRKNPTPPGLSQAAISCARRSLSAAPHGDAATGITAEAVQRPGCLCEIARPTPGRPDLRPSGREVSGPQRHPCRLHCARHAHHRDCRTGLPGERKGPPATRLVQQCRGAAAQVQHPLRCGQSRHRAVAGLTGPYPRMSSSSLMSSIRLARCTAVSPTSPTCEMASKRSTLTSVVQLGIRP